jgi:3-dehydroquinate synthase
LELFESFTSTIELLLKRDSGVVEQLVARCAAIKADVVSRDEREGDLRRVLNLGHTVGHALEAAGGFRGLKHGEAVGYGMIAASRISQSLGLMSETEALRVESSVNSVGTLPPLRGFRLKPVLEALQHDKKVRDGAVHFVLPRRIGRVEITPNVPLTLVRETVKVLLHENEARR